jgi:SAM-dependent methyltransferase
MTDVEGIAAPGLLSPLLARLRQRQADRLIPAASRSGRILDVGCGTWPAFLARTRFREKHGLDRRSPSAASPPGIEVRQHDVGTDGLPYPDRHFDVVTLLAVVEHLAPEVTLFVLQEVYRVLCDAGVAVVTVPSAQGESLLHLLSVLRITSREHHEEHQNAYDPGELRAVLGRAGFPDSLVEVGRFELGLNLWARATRPPP